MKSYISAGVLAMGASAIRSASSDEVPFPTMMLDQAFEPATANIPHKEMVASVPC
jgi:hypothetical protein